VSSEGYPDDNVSEGYPEEFPCYRLHVDEVRAGEPLLEAPIPAVGAESGMTIAAAIKTLRPPSESGGEEEEEDGWEEEPVGGAEVAVSGESGEEAEAGSGGGGAGGSDPAHVHSDEAAAGGAAELEGGGQGGKGETGEEEGRAGGDEGGIKLRMAKLAEQGGIAHQLGSILMGAHPHLAASGGGLHPEAAEVGMRDGGANGFNGMAGLGAGVMGPGWFGGGGYGGGLPSGPIVETLAANRKGQEELAGAVREVKGRVEEVRGKVDRLLEEAERKNSGSADLLMGDVLVQSIQKLVLDNEALRSDALRLREKVPFFFLFLFSFVSLFVVLPRAGCSDAVRL